MYCNNRLYIPQKTPQWVQGLDNKPVLLPSMIREPRKPIEVVIKPEFRQEPPAHPYTYPKPSLQRRHSKVEFDPRYHTLHLQEKTTEPDGPETHCTGCHRPLHGKIFTTTTNRPWHSACFRCHHCYRALDLTDYIEHQDPHQTRPYCVQDYHELFGEPCDYCQLPIQDDQKIICLGKYYHVGHAFCRACHEPFQEGDRILEHDGMGYCEEDFNQLFGKVCQGCGEYITQSFLKALGGEWHHDCFNCTGCKAKISSGTFMVKGGKPYCSKGCQQSMSPKQQMSISVKKTCHHCQMPIEGRSVCVFDRFYHLSHFQCSCCEKILSPKLKDLYEEVNDRIVCTTCLP